MSSTHSAWRLCEVRDAIARAGARASSRSALETISVCLYRTVSLSVLRELSFTFLRFTHDGAPDKKSVVENH